MREQELRELAAELAMARRKLELVPDPIAWPADVAEAYRLQELVSAAYREEGSGWKVGATNDKALEAMKLEAPFYGPMFKAHIHETNATIAFPPGAKGVECEIAFRLKNDLPAREGGHDLAAVKAAIGSVHPAIEIIGARIDGPGPGNGLQPIGDFGGNVDFVYGRGVEDWSEIDLEAETADCHQNDEKVASGEGRIVLGNPLNSIVWLTQQGIALKDGDFVSTGTLTGLTPTQAGDRIEGNFATIGSVSVTFAD
ncbi:MAG: fumarylacetoacetate hydrolase family protein [Pseudomonadota bacterium]